MPALLTRMSRRPASLFDPFEGGGDARRFGDIGLQVFDAFARFGGRELVERVDPGAIGDEPLGDCVANAPRRAGDNSDAALKRIRHVLSLFPQYISQPPLTLIVAPVM